MASNQIESINKQYSEISNYSINTSGSKDVIEYDLSGYTTVQTISDKAFLDSETSFINLDSLLTNVNVTQPNPKKIFNCNFSFSANFNVKIRLPKIFPDEPDFSLLFKIDTFSNEVAHLNDDLIKAIQSLNCCGVAESYNKHIVPFFRWFADTKDSKDCGDGTQNCGPMFSGDTFPVLMLNIAKPLIQLYLIVRPFACLIRPLPGNPWFPWDFDVLKFFRFILDYYDTYIDYIISGKIMDPLIDVVSDIRKKMDKCVFGIGETNNYLSQNTYKNLIKKNMLLQNIEKEINIYNEKINRLKRKKNKIVEKIANVNNTPIFFYNNSNNSDVVNELNYEYFINPITYNSEELSTENVKKLTVNDLTHYTSVSLTNIEIKNEQERLKLIKNLLNEDTNKFKSFLIKKIAAGNEKDFNNFIAYTELGKFEKNNLISGLKNYTLVKIDELLNLYEELDEVNNAIKKYTDIIEEYKKEKLKISNSNINSTPNGSLSKTYLEYQIKNNIANRNHNVCNCIIDTVFPDLLVPKTIYLNDYSMNELSQIENKIDYSIKSNELPEYCQTLKRNNKDSNFLYCSEFIQKLNSSFNSDIENYYFKYITFVDSINYNDLNSSTLSKMPENFINTYNNLINNMLSNPNDSGSKSSIIQDYLKVVQNNYSNIPYKIVQKFEIDNVVYDLPYGAGTRTYKEPTVEFLNNISDGLFNLKNIDVFQSYRLKIIYTATSRACNDIVSKLKIILDEFENKDDENFQDFKSKISAKFEIIDIKLSLNIINLSFTDQEKFIKYKNFIKNFCENYRFYDIENDPQDLFIQSLKAYSPNFSNLDLIALKDEINQLYNEYLTKRKIIVNKAFDYIVLINIFQNKIKKVLDNINSNETTNYIHYIQIKSKLNIDPCSCDIFCQVLQYIIDKFLSLLSLLIQMLINALLDWIMKSWIGKLIKLIIAKIKCLIEFLSIKDNFEELNNLKDNLKKALFGRIKLYKELDICFLNQNNQNQNINPNLNNENQNNYDYLLNTNANQNNNNTLILPPEDKIDPTSLETHNNNDQNITVNIDNNGNTGVIQMPGTSTIYDPTAIADSIEQSLPATLITTDGVEIGTPNEHGFPLLSFNCDCDDVNCNSCKNSDKKDKTIQFLHEV